MTLIAALKEIRGLVRNAEEHAEPLDRISVKTIVDRALSDRDYRDDTAAYVASVVWLRLRGLTELGEEMRSEMIREGAIDPEEWNRACDGLADYTRRNAGEKDAGEFLAARVEA